VGRVTSARSAAGARRMLVLTRVMMTMLSMLSILSVELSIELQQHEQQEHEQHAGAALKKQKH
jgi:hypothetical protein